VVTMALWYIAFFLSLRGHMNSAYYTGSNGTAIDINMGLEMEQSIHLDTAVDHGYNIPWVIFSPLIKLCAMSIIIAAIINRQNLEVICPVQFILCLRQLVQVFHDAVQPDASTDTRALDLREKRLIIFSFAFTISACALTIGQHLYKRHLGTVRPKVPALNLDVIF
jgi:hypothetical protein